MQGSILKQALIQHTGPVLFFLSPPLIYMYRIGPESEQ